MAKKEVKKVSTGVVRIAASWDGVQGEHQKFSLKFSPDPLNPDTNLRGQIVLLANVFAAGTKQLMSVIKPLPQPTEEELKAGTYDFAEHSKDYGEGLFALYNYKKAVMEEFVSIVERVLPDAFHDVLFVKGAQEKIFEKMRAEHALKHQEDLDIATGEPVKKGEVS